MALARFPYHEGVRIRSAVLHSLAVAGAFQVRGQVLGPFGMSLLAVGAVVACRYRWVSRWTLIGEVPGTTSVVEAKVSPRVTLAASVGRERPFSVCFG